MIEHVDYNDSTAVRNMNNMLAFYEELLSKRDPAGAAAAYLAPDYIQHNPVVADGPGGFVDFFQGILDGDTNPVVEVKRIIAVGDHVWAHSHFRNMLTADPDDPGLTVVDIWRMNANGLAVEHWDVLQQVGTPDDGAPWVAPGVPRANANGLF